MQRFTLMIAALGIAILIALAATGEKTVSRDTSAPARDELLVSAPPCERDAVPVLASYRGQRIHGHHVVLVANQQDCPHVKVPVRCRPRPMLIA